MIFPIETFKSKFPFHSNYQIKKKKKLLSKKIIQLLFYYIS